MNEARHFDVEAARCKPRVERRHLGRHDDLDRSLVPNAAPGRRAARDLRPARENDRWDELWEGTAAHRLEGESTRIPFGAELGLGVTLRG